MSGGETLTVSVVVPTYRRPDELGRCLTALAAQTRPADEVVVVVRDTDTESLEVTRAWADRLPLRTVAPDEPGIVPAIAAGLAAVRCDVAAWTDDDAEPLPDWVERIAGWFADPGIAAVGGPDLPGLQIPPARRFGQISYVGRVIAGRPPDGFGARPVDHLRGCNMAVRAPVPPPERRLRGDGSAYEMDICLRARRRGRVMWDSKLAVRHEEARRISEAGQVTERPSAGDTAATLTAAYNVCLVLSKNTAGRMQRGARLAFQVAVGQRQSLGMVIGVLLALRTRDPAQLRLTAQVVRAKLAGWRAGAAPLTREAAPT